MNENNRIVRNDLVPLIVDGERMSGLYVNGNGYVTVDPTDKTPISDMIIGHMQDPAGAEHVCFARNGRTIPADQAIAESFWQFDAYRVDADRGRDINLAAHVNFPDAFHLWYWVELAKQGKLPDGIILLETIYGTVFFNLEYKHVFTVWGDKYDDPEVIMKILCGTYLPRDADTDKIERDLIAIWAIYDFEKKYGTFPSIAVDGCIVYPKGMTPNKINEIKEYKSKFTIAR